MENSINEKIDAIQDYLQTLERRMRIIEDEIGLNPIRDEADERASQTLERTKSKRKSDDNRIESGFGEKGLAWIGNIVLFFGIVFLVQYIQKQGYNNISIVFGYAVVACIFFLAKYLKKSYSTLSKTFNFTALVLLFYVSLRIHFFTTTPIITSTSITILILLMVVAFELVYSIRKRSVTITSMALIMLVVTAILSNSTHPLLLILTATATISTILFIRLGWWNLIVLSVFLVYIGFFMWFLNNPIMGGPLEFISSHDYGYFYLFGIGAIFSIAAIDFKKEELSENIATIIVVINGLLFTMLLSLFVINFFKTENVYLFLIIAVFCLSFSVYLKSRSAWKMIPAFYALYGFLALSIAVHDMYGFPRVYWLLAIQSLLVLTMALWFRNKVIVLMNAMLFVLLFIVYLGAQESINEVNYSFAIVALATARILNWKKDRLEIKTEMLRDVYLISAFIMVPYALYHSLPANFITLSWTLLAIIYFALSIALKNPKYRYIALGTMMASAIHLFMVDLARIEIVYRVIAFLFLAMISIFISVYYTRKVKNSKREERID